jgi:photosystem II stability/assembly factor-like uncharacterized protein
MTWENIGGGLPAGMYCDVPLVIDAQTYIVGCGQVGIYRTVDGGATWAEVASSGGVSAPVVEADSSIYWLSPNGGLTRSTDSGKTWIEVTSPGMFNTVFSLLELPNGNLAAVAADQNIVVSSNRGVTWTVATSPLPINPMENNHGIAYSAQRKAFYVWRNNGVDAVPVDAVLRYDFDYQAP